MIHCDNGGGERERDFRIPVIYCSFFLSSLTGGILLTCWILDVKGSQHWFPILSLTLIALPWIFWFLTYIYTFIKPCFPPHHNNNAGMRNHAKPAASSTVNVDFTFPSDPPPVNISPTGNQRQVQFGEVVVIGCDGGQSFHSADGVAAELSGSSTRENERPLNVSVSS